MLVLSVRVLCINLNKRIRQLLAQDCLIVPIFTLLVMRIKGKSFQKLKTKQESSVNFALTGGTIHLNVSLEIIAKNAILFMQEELVLFNNLPAVLIYKQN